MVEYHDPVGEHVGLLEVLGGEEHRGALRHEVRDELPQFRARARIESGGRLVEDEHDGAPNEGCPEIQSASHATGVGLHGAIGGLGEREPLEGLDSPRC